MPSLKYIILSLHCINVVLKDPMGHIDHQLLQDCCWTLSYITEYNGLGLDVSSVLLDSQIVDILIGLLFHDNDQDVSSVLLD